MNPVNMSTLPTRELCANESLFMYISGLPVIDILMDFIHFKLLFGVLKSYIFHFCPIRIEKSS